MHAAGLRMFLALAARDHLRAEGAWEDGDRVEVQLRGGCVIVRWFRAREECGVSFVVEGLGIEPDRSRGTSV